MGMIAKREDKEQKGIYHPPLPKTRPSKLVVVNPLGRERKEGTPLLSNSISLSLSHIYFEEKNSVR